MKKTRKFDGRKRFQIALLCLCILVTLFVFSIESRAADTSVVPADRRTVWNAGIPGGIPPDDAVSANRLDGVGPATVHVTLSTNGSDNRTAIQNALNGAGSAATKTNRKIVQLNAGTFNVSGSLSIPSHVILRGSVGANNEPVTILNETGTNGQVISIWGGSSNWGTVRSLSGTHNKGSATITIDNAADFNVGDIITIDQTRDGSQNGPSNGIAQYNVPNPGDWVWNLSSLWYQRQPYSAGNGVQFLFPDSTTWRLIAQRTEVLAKNGNTLTIYDPATGRGNPLHVTYYMSPQVYRSAGTGEMTRYAGVENVKIWPRGTNGQRSVSVGAAAFCWFKNIEIDGTRNSWAGRHIEFYAQTYRCELRGSYIHGSSNYNQGGNAYCVDYQGSNLLIEDNIIRQCNKPVVSENSGGSNIIAYNYVDEAVIGSLTGDWQEAAISTHASFSHSELFEGNHTPNLGSDATHGNNGWVTMFRNYATGQNSSGYATSYRRAIWSDGWNREMTSIGNVLWKPNSGVQNLFTASTQPSEAGNTNGIGYRGIVQTSVYLIGSNAWTTGTGNKPGADNMDNGQAYSLFHRHLDYDDYTKAQYNNPANPVKTLSSSLYRDSKPEFFGNYEWPWVNPAGATPNDRVKVLPAKARWDAGTPFALAPGVGIPDTEPPTSPTNLAATSPSQSSISVSWTASTDTGGSGVAGYRVERCQGLPAACPDGSFTQVGTPTTPSFTDTGLTANTDYSYRVRAFDGATPPNLSGWTNTVSAKTQTPDTQAPTTPANLQSSVVSSSNITLTWTASTDNVAVTGYTVERCSGSGCTNFAEVGTPSTNSYSDTGLTAQTLYRYRVRANDAANNNSSYSNIAEGTTPQAPPTPTFVAEYETAWNSSTSPKTTANFSVQQGDILVAYAVNESSSATIATPPTGTLTGTWTLQQTISTSGYTALRLWSMNVATNQTNVNVSFTNGGGNFGGNILHFRNASSVGVTAQANSTTGNPTLIMNGVSDNSSIVMVNGDWSARTGARTYNTTQAGAFTETSYYADGTSYGLQAGYYANAGTSGNKTIGLTAPTGMTWALAALEVKGNPTAQPVSCNTVTTANFSDAGYSAYGAPFDAFQTSTNLMNATCTSTDTHTVTLTTGVTGDTTRIVYTKGYWYDATGTAWRQYTGTCTGAQNGEWCQGSVSATITDLNVSTASSTTPTYLVGMTCSVQGGSWKCGCRDTTCANFSWQVQGAGM